ncbi:hypothetical protein [Hyphococcus sp.]|uniref:hypothetical protein n=1 Tax=Hyphococcus sp. TaxID=2038636 RepID=UPI003CCB7727
MKEIINLPVLNSARRQRLAARSIATRNMAQLPTTSAEPAVKATLIPLTSSRRAHAPSPKAGVYSQIETRASQYGAHALDVYY